MILNMKKIIRILAFCILPTMLYSQSKINSNVPPQLDENSSRIMLLIPSATDLTIVPDSVFFTQGGSPQAIIEISNNTNQPINLIQVQSQCSPCQGGWGWWVASMSVSVPHYIYPGQHITATIKYWTTIKDEYQANFLHDSLYIVSSVGNQYCHIFLDPSLITSIGKNARNNFIIFPNPATSTVTIKFSDNFSGYGFLSVYNSNGEKIKELVLNSSDTEINMNGIPAGIYLFEITDGKSTWKQKVLKAGN